MTLPTIPWAVTTEPLWQSHPTTAAKPAVLEPVLDPDLSHDTGQGKGGGWIVTVYNNDHNTYQEVIAILVLATRCTAEEAYIEAWEIDHYGHSVVHRASESACQAAAEIIATIGIKVEATPDPLA